MLEDVKIARPCGADWNNMTGDDRVRFCNLCQLNVYNLSAMERDEAEEFVAANEGKVCLRLYKREDGTVITQDCPVGLAAVRRRIGSFVASGAALLTVFWAGAGRAAEQADGPLTEGTPVASPIATTRPPVRVPTATTPVTPVVTPPTTPVVTPPATPITPQPPRVLMGKPAMRPQQVPPKPEAPKPEEKPAEPKPPRVYMGK